LEIISFIRVPDRSRRSSRDTQTEESKYVRVPYEIALSGTYSGLVTFLKKLEDSERLVNVASIKMYTGQGRHPVDANIVFNIFYSKVGVEVS
jgi:Tfp pilus assembly protein PilO